MRMRLHRKDDRQQIAQCVLKRGVSHGVPDPPPLGCREDETATAETGQVVADTRAAEVKVLCDRCWMGDAVEHREKDRTARRVADRSADHHEGIQLGHYAWHPSTVH